MKFLCIPCDEQMVTQADGIMPKEKESIALKFKCNKCGNMIAMLTNKFETEFVNKLGVEAGGPSEIADTPFAMMGNTLPRVRKSSKKPRLKKVTLSGLRKRKTASRRCRFS